MEEEFAVPVAIPETVFSNVIFDVVSKTVSEKSSNQWTRLIYIFDFFMLAVMEVQLGSSLLCCAAKEFFYCW